MLRISRLADYAVLIATFMAREKNIKFSSRDISKMTSINLPTVNKILSLLAKKEIIIAIRGSKGGYKINQSIEKISIKDLVEAIDGPVALTVCSEDNKENKCDLYSGCISRLNWQKVNDTIINSLSEIKLSQMNNVNFLKISEPNKITDVKRYKGKNDARL